VAIYKITLTRNGNRPRLSSLAAYLDVVSYIKANSLKHAAEIADDIVKEHKFVDCVVERFDPLEFKKDVSAFVTGG